MVILKIFFFVYKNYWKIRFWQFYIQYKCHRIMKFYNLKWENPFWTSLLSLYLLCWYLLLSSLLSLNPKRSTLETDKQWSSLMVISNRMTSLIFLKLEIKKTLNLQVRKFRHRVKCNREKKYQKNQLLVFKNLPWIMFDPKLKGHI